MTTSMKSKSKKVEKKSAKKPAKNPKRFRPAWGIANKTEKTPILQDLARQILQELAIDAYNADKCEGKTCITFPKRKEAEECAMMYLVEAVEAVLAGLACDGHEISEAAFRKLISEK